MVVWQIIVNRPKRRRRQQRFLFFFLFFFVLGFCFRTMSSGSRYSPHNLPGETIAGQPLPQQEQQQQQQKQQPKTFSEAVSRAMPKRRGPLTTLQLLGLFLFLVGLVAVFLSFEDSCPHTSEAELLQNPEDAIPCDDTGPNRMLIVGLVCILLFCCCPAFALGDARPFYEAFPWVKRAFNRRRQADGTFHAHAASVKTEEQIV